MVGPYTCTDRPVRCLIVLFGILCICGFSGANLPYSVPTETRSYWINKAKDDLIRARSLQPNIAVAKNVILFIGDGMGVSTVTASRILKGQLQGRNGEEEQLSFEMFPHIGMSKTYNEDAQTPDSAGTATAFLCGVKTNMGILGIDARGRRGQCETANGTELTSMLDWSRDAGKSVGLVTTTRITHATPAAAYAHSAERNWESDKDMAGVTGNCVDIARQLVDDNIDINVILGGGRREFLRNNDTDPEAPTYVPDRRDGRNLIEDWQTKQAELNRNYKYVWNLSEFESVNASSTDYLLGLFNPSHMEYELDRPDDKAGEPSIEQMTEKAIEILSKNDKGFFLLVEGGRIDHAHHASNAKRSLHDTLVFDRAVARAVAMTSETDTLIVVSSDHSHVFTIGGYPTRGNPILGLTDDREGGHKLGTDTKPFTTLLYTNGPGAFVRNDTPMVRPDPSLEETNSTDYKQQSAVHLSSETHAGEDVAIYARGPMSHLFHGLHEQNYIAHVMAYAACVGDYSDPSMCASYDVTVYGPTSGSIKNSTSKLSTAIFFFFLLNFIKFTNLCM